MWHNKKQHNAKPSAYYLWTTFILTLLACLQVHAEQGQHDYCQEIRKEREHAINANPQIEINGKLHKDESANCFTPTENLYYISLVEAQKTMSFDTQWYQDEMVNNEKKAELGCKIMGYGENDFGSKPLKSCIRKRTHELMQQHKTRYQNEAVNYLNNRNRQGEKMVASCVNALYQNLSDLPKQLKLPLAYYDEKVITYPSWYFDDKFFENNRIEKIKNTYVSDIVYEVLNSQCPGDMIFWLYIED